MISRSIASTIRSLKPLDRCNDFTAAHARRRLFEALKALPNGVRKSESAAYEGVRRIDEPYAIERLINTSSEEERTGSNWFFADTVKGAQTSAVPYSIVSTARAKLTVSRSGLRRMN